VAIPIRSRLLDYLEPELPTGRAPAGSSEPKSRRSRILEYVEYTEYVTPDPTTEQPSGPKPGVPAYHTPVFVPAHPRHVDVTDTSGTRTRVPFIAYELFEHPTDGTVALAFTTLDKLVAELGEAQPWVATSIGPLAEGMREHGAVVRLDPRIAPGARNWQPADLTAYAREAS